MTNLFIDTNLLVYMNTPGKDYDKYTSYYEDQLKDNRLYINIIVLDELLYISQSKYKISYEDTFEFIESMILPFVKMIPLDQEDYVLMKEILKYCVHPSDAIITASMRKSAIEFILSEDKGFDSIPGIKRMWLKK